MRLRFAALVIAIIAGACPDPAPRTGSPPLPRDATRRDVGCATAVAGDGSAQIRGVVIDNLDQALPGATVVASTTVRDDVFSDLADSRGAFRIEVPAGVYTLTIYFGDATAREDCVVAWPGSTVTRDVRFD